MKTDGFPANEQRVRMILEGSGSKAVQMPVTVIASGEDGHVKLRVAARPFGTALEAGSSATLEYVRGGAVYRMNTTVAQMEDNVVTMKVEELKKIQRRRHTRLYVSMPVEFSLREGAKAANRVASFAGRLRQIGFEGCAMLTDLALGQGDGVRLVFDLDGVGVALEGQVVWAGGPGTLKESGGGNFSHAVGIAFEPMDPDTRGHVDNFIMSELKRRPS
jgi:hypothetical protein